MRRGKGWGLIGNEADDEENTEAQGKQLPLRNVKCCHCTLLQVEKDLFGKRQGDDHHCDDCDTQPKLHLFFWHISFITLYKYKNFL